MSLSRRSTPVLCNSIQEFIRIIGIMSTFEDTHLVSLTLDRYSVATAYVSRHGIIILCTVRQHGTNLLYKTGDNYTGLQLEIYNQYKDRSYTPWGRSSPYYELLVKLKEVK